MSYKERYRREHAGDIKDREKQILAYKVIIANIVFLALICVVVGISCIDGNTAFCIGLTIVGAVVGAIAAEIGNLFDDEEGEEE